LSREIIEIAEKVLRALLITHLLTGRQACNQIFLDFSEISGKNLTKYNNVINFFIRLGGGL
jgi:hypothetical protein